MTDAGQIDIDWVRAEGARLRRWGRWGEVDGKGSLNLLTPERVLAAVAEVRVGRVISLAMPFDQHGPQNDTIRHNPKLTMTAIGDQTHLPGGFQYADDTLFMSMQGSTQWDALSHAFYDGVMWNGHRAADTLDEHGARANPVTDFRNGVVGRGVLLDVARHLGVDCLEDDQVIPPEQLDEVAAAQGTEVRPGDIVLIRTGRVGKGLREGFQDYRSFMSHCPGLSVRCADWLVTRDVAAVAADNVAVEVSVAEGPGLLMPLHMICQRDAGIPFGEIFDLEELSVACAELGTWTFLLTAAPLPVTGGVGSPVNPLAIL